MNMSVLDRLIPSFDDVMSSNPLFLDEPILPAEAARVLKTTTSALSALRARHQGPDYIKTGKRVYYLRRDLIDWLLKYKNSARPPAKISRLMKSSQNSR